MINKLKFFATMLTCILLSINQMWAGTEFTDNFNNVGTGSSTTVSSRTGWGSFTKCYAQYNTGIRMGTGSATGSITKTAMTGISGTVTLTVQVYVARYNTDAGNLNISVGGAGTASTSSITLSGNAGVTSTTSAASWTSTYLKTFTITGATSATTITFSSSKNRIVLGPITITSESAGKTCVLVDAQGTVNSSFTGNLPTTARAGNDGYTFAGIWSKRQFHWQESSYAYASGYYYAQNTNTWTNGETLYAVYYYGTGTYYSTYGDGNYLNVNPSSGSIYITSNTAPNYAKVREGTVVTLTATGFTPYTWTIKEHESGDDISYTTPTSTTARFTMPDAEVDVVACYDLTGSNVSVTTPTLTQTSVTLNWSCSGAYAYQVRITNPEGDNIYNKTKTSTSLTIDTLRPHTTYTVQAAAVNQCLDAEKISNVYSGSFTTLGYTVTYNQSGEDVTTSVPTDANQYGASGSVTLLDKNSESNKANYYFAGWTDNAGGTGTIYKPGDTYTINANTTFYAKWVACSAATTPSSLSVSGSGSSNITFSWSAVTGATKYQLVLMDENSTVYEFETTSTSKTVNLSDVGPEGDYLGQVRAWNGTIGYCYEDFSDDIEFVSGCSDWGFHYGTDGQSDWTEECFTQVDDSHEWQITDFVIPNKPNWYVDNSAGNDAKKVTTTWSSGMYFAYSQGDGVCPMLGPATGAIGTIRIYDNSDWNNRYAGFIPNGYVLKFNTTEYPFTFVSGNQYRSSVVTYNSTSALYNVSVGVENGSGNYVSTDNTQQMKHLFLDVTTKWHEDNAKFVLYDITNTAFTCAMTQVPGSTYLYEGWVPSNCTAVIFVRRGDNTLSFDGKWNQTADLTLESGKNLFTITDWGAGSWSAYNKTGQFRIDTDSRDKNWYVRFVPHYVLTYDKNDENASGTMSVQTVAVDAASKSVTVAANGFTAPTGYHFDHWDTSPDDNGTDYDPSDSYTLSADVTLYAIWAPNTHSVNYSLPSNGDYTISVAGGTATSATKNADYGQTVTLAATPNTGYEFTSWDVYKTGESGTKVTVTSNQFTMPDYDVTVTASFTAINYNVTYSAPTNGNYTIKVASGTASSATKTANYGQTITLAATPSEGYQLSSWTIKNTSTSADVTGSVSLSSTTSSPATFTMPAYGVTVIATFGASNYTLAWDWNGGSTSSTTHTAAGPVAYGTTIVYPAIGTMSKTGHTFTGWSPNPSTMPAENTEIVAQWSINSYKVTIESVDDVTISATTPSISEGDYGNANYNSTVTLSYSGIASGLTWGGWRVYKDGDPSTTVTVTSNQFTMPAYDVKVTAVLYGDVMAWCEPDITVSDGFCLTSYYIEGAASASNSVYTTAAAENLLTIVSTDLAGVDKLVVSYLNGSDEAVTLTSSPFRLCNDGVSPANYNVADGGAAATSFTINVSGTCNLSYSIRYKPTGYNQMDNYKLRIVMKKGSDEIKTILRNLNGRSLPEEFVIAVKGGDQWYALPNTLAATQGAQGSIVPIKITVDNPSGTPTRAEYAPNTAIYKGRAKYATANRSSMALTSTGSNYLQTSSSSSVYQMWLSGSGDAADVDWYFKSSDRSVYELAMDPVNSPSKKMGYYNAQYIGYHTNPSSSAIYLLPVENKYTDFPAVVTEWGRKSVVLDVDAHAAVSAAAHIEAGSPETAASFGQTCTSVKNSPSTNNYTLSFSTTDFSTHKGELLYIDWLDGEDNIIGGSQVTIPWIIATNSTMGVIDNVQAHWKDWEVHVLPGVTLEADGNSFSAASNVAKVKTLEIYPGATVKVTSGTLDVTNNLILRYGWTRAGSKNYSVAQMQIKRGVGGANLTTNHVYADWYIDYDQYYSISVPWKVTVANITYLNSSNAASGGMKLRYYDGEQRASSGQGQIGQNWKEYSPLPTYLEPSKGYALSARRPTGKAFSILRMPLTIPSSAWTALGEQGAVSETHKDQVSVTGWGHGTAVWYAMGWNFIGNPYMSTFNGNDDGISGKIEYQDGGSVRYATIPDLDFQNYYQVNITEANLKPASGFFIQANSASAQNVTFSADKIVNPSMPTRYLREASIPDQEAYIRLSHEGGKDQMGLIIGEDYTEAYEPNADLAKIIGEGNFVRTYMRYTDMDMAYVAINETLAKELIPVTVQLPVAGEYTFSLTNSSVVENLEGVYLIDYANNGKITNLIEDNYIFTAEAGTYTDRFVINGVVGHRNTPEGVDAVDANTDTTKPVKFLYRDKIYILNQGVIYDATGKKVREINK